MRHAVGPLVLALGIAAPAGADTADRPDYRPDGSVQVGGQVFATASDYFHSAAFRARGRCGSDGIVAPALAAAAAGDCSMNRTTIDPEYDDARVFVIQVVFHVIKRGDGTGDITPALLASQIDVLNEDYDAIPNTLGAGGTNAKLQFVLARFDPDGQPTTGIDVVTNDSYFQDPGAGATTR